MTTDRPLMDRLAAHVPQASADRIDAAATAIAAHAIGVVHTSALDDADYYLAGIPAHERPMPGRLGDLALEKLRAMLNSDHEHARSTDDHRT